MNTNPLSPKLPMAAAITLALGLAAGAHAQPAPSGPPAAAALPAAADANSILRIATGAKGKGFSRVFADVQSVCGAQVAMTEVTSEGGLQNLTTLAANRADLGFVQLDTLRELKTSDEAIGQLQMVQPMNANLLHLVARQDGHPRWWLPLDHRWVNKPITRFTDLQGLPVAAVGSARSLGRLLDRQHDLGLVFKDVETDEQALQLVKSGQAAAMLTTSGWPNGPVQRLGRADRLMLLPFDLPVKAPYQLVRKNYDNIDTFNFDFLASPNLLVTRPFAPGGAKGQAVQVLRTCLQKNLRVLQEGAFEPAWREVRERQDGENDLWPAFGVAQPAPAMPAVKTVKAQR